MSRINFYILLLIAPAIIFSLRLILEELANSLAVSDYAKQLDWLNSLIRKVSGTEIKQSEINEELVSILQMISIMISSGESPMSAMRYVSKRSDGILPRLIRESLNKYEDGRSITQTLDFLATATGSTQVRRLTNSIQIAIHRGTPVLDVLNNQVLALNKQINFIKPSGVLA